MNRDVARTLLTREMQKLARRPYHELRQQAIDKHIDVLTVAHEDVEYQIEVEIRWDSEPEDDVRVIGGIDDGSLLSSLRPLCEDFIVKPDGTLDAEWEPRSEDGDDL